MITKQELIDFQAEIEEVYKTGVIRGPIHLRDGGEDELISLFKYIKEDDYVFSTWANNRHALLKGVPRESVKARILEGRSMAMNFPEHRFYTSAIVGGIASIAVGVALGLKRNQSNNHVYVFLGDMAFQAGIVHESIRYSIYNNLPIRFVVEDNGKSVDTPTRQAWGNDKFAVIDLADYYNKQSIKYMGKHIVGVFMFESKYPHSGVGQFVSF